MKLLTIPDVAETADTIEPGRPVAAVQRNSAGAELWHRASNISRAVKAEAASTESVFAAAGERLFSTMGELTALTESCGELIVELESSDVRAAAAALEAVGTDLEAIGREGGRRGELLRRLLRLAEAVGQAVDGALSLLRPATIIAMNAKVEAARLGDAGGQFTDFADEINAAFQLAKSSLQVVAEHMEALRTRVQVACKQEAELAEHLTQALEDVPRRIAASLAAITARSASAAAVANKISAESHKVSAGASDAVMSLQVGDNARQRLEHVGFALDLAERVGAGNDFTALGDGPFVVADDPERLLAACCELQSAQLADTSRELSRDLQATVAALETLAEAAEDVAAHGGGLFSTGHDGRSFLGQLGQSIGQARALFAQLELAWSFANELVASVSHLATDLQAPITAVASAEREVRRLAQNAIVKSGRVGERGRALAVIAKQLEECVARTIDQTSVVTERLAELAPLAQELAASDENEARQSVATAGRSIEDAVERLAQMEKRVAAGLRALRDDSAAIARRIRSTADDLRSHQRSGASLSDAADQLRAVSVAAAVGGQAARGEVFDALLQRIFQTYTMAREREVHTTIVEGEGFVRPAE